VEAYSAVFSDAVVERSRFPGVGEEHHGDCLPEIVKLEASGADC